jgi:hypothetical protein
MVPMSIKDEFNEFVRTGKEGSDNIIKDVPDSWRPRSEIGAEGGFIVSTPAVGENIPGARDALIEAGLNPDEWEVVNMRQGRWQRWDETWLTSIRLNIIPARGNVKDFDAEKLMEEIAIWTPSKSNDFAGELTAVYSVGDTQYGKDDTPSIVNHMLRAINESVEHHAFLSSKYKIGQIALPQLGDCIEGMTSQKGKVMGRHDIGVSQQVQVGRRVLMKQIKEMAQLAPKIIVPVVPGNHDEVQRFLVSRPEDSWALEIVKAVEDACMENEFLKDRVEFRYPALDDSTLAVNLSGVLYGMAHGHQARDMVKWWHGQSMGRCSVAHADILNVGHLHHYHAQSVGPRLFIQNPAMDGGSAWYRDKSGMESAPGIVSMVVGDGFDSRRELTVLGGFR